MSDAQARPLRVLVCSTGIPHAESFKGLSASLMSLYGYIDNLARTGHRVLHLLILDKARQDPAQLAAYTAAMSARGIDVVAWETGNLLEDRSHSWEAHRPRELPANIRESIAAWKPDTAFCLDVFVAGILLRHKPCPTLVQVHDPKFQTLWFHSLYETKERWSYALQLPFDWWRCRLWKTFYTRTLRQADRVITVAQSTVRPLARMGIASRYVPMAWPDVTRPWTGPPPPPSGTPTFLFLGNLSGLGSRSALHFLLEGIYPRLVKAWGAGNFSLLICGAHTLPKWVQPTIATMPEVTFLGFVDDLEGILLRCHAALAPMDVKVGNRTRILTAMSLGVLTINHVNTALGNTGLRDGVTCYLAGDPETFVERMRRAVDRPPEVDAIIERARKLFDDEFRPDAATATLSDELRAMLVQA